MIQVKTKENRTASRSVYQITINKKEVVKIWPSINAAVESIFLAANQDDLYKSQIENRIRHAIRTGKEKFHTYWSWNEEVAKSKVKKESYL